MTVDGRAGYAKGRARREEILDVATTVFGQVGYRSASLREIAQRVGISHPGLLHHFPSKELLLTAVLEHRSELDAAEYEPIVDDSDGLSRLRALVAMVEHNVATPGLVELYCVLTAEATAPDHPAHDFFVRRYTAYCAVTTETFAMVQRDGGLRDGVSPEQASRGLFAMVEGLQVHWLLDPGSVDLAGAIRQYIAQQLSAPF